MAPSQKLVVAVLLLGYQIVISGVAVSMETEDNLSTYDGSEEEALGMVSGVLDGQLKADSGIYVDDKQPEGRSSPSTGSQERPETGSSKTFTPGKSLSSIRTENYQVTFDPTTKPHVKPRSRRKPKRMEEKRRMRLQEPDDLEKTLRSHSQEDPELPEDENDLIPVILSLKDQIRESQTLQTISRSILNVVQEKQQALEEDLSFLKNEISALHRLQSKDHDTITALKDLVADNTWGVTSLVSSQEQLKKDVASLKHEQDVHNASIWQLEEVALTGVKHDQSLEDSVQRLNNEIRQIREWREADHRNIKQVKQMVAEHLPAVVDNRRRHRQEHSNHIDQKSSELDVDVDFDRLNSMAAELDEKHHLVEQGIQDLSRKEAKLKQDMQHFSKKFGLYDTELSRVYTMFYNLSFQMSSLENKMLQQQQDRYETNLAELQRSLMNFTQHMYSLEQRTHSGASGYQNSTGIRNQYDIEMANKVIDSHQRRIDLLEKLLHEHKLEQNQLHDLNRMKLGRMNKSISGFYKSFQDHYAESTDVFDFIDEKFQEFNRRIDANDNRLMRVEVKVLNESLGRCETSNTNMKQDREINELKETSLSLSKKVDDHNNLIDRLDHGVGRIYEDLGKYSKRLDDVVSEIDGIAEVIPQLSVLAVEVQKFIKQLPQDCEDVSLRQLKPQSGTYLIRGGEGSSSASVFCEFVGNTAWTVIQRRQDGSVSFAQDWEAYKHGFGSPDGEFWIGNDILHHLTAHKNYLLRIDMWDLQDQRWWAEYDAFGVGGEGANYKLHLGGYHGNATDALKYSADMPFSTVDRDNDHSSTHCARFYTAGWWYKHCHYGNLNGRYTVGVVWFNHNLDEWIQLKRAVMKIRQIEQQPRNNERNPEAVTKPNKTSS